MRGNRYFLTSRNCEHHQYPLKKNIVRVQDRFDFNYFEPTADGTGVKVTYITLVPSSEDGYTDTLQAVVNLTHFLRQRDREDMIEEEGFESPSHGADSEATPEKEEAGSMDENRRDGDATRDEEHENEQVEFNADPNRHLDQEKDPKEKLKTETSAEPTAEVTTEEVKQQTEKVEHEPEEVK